MKFGKKLSDELETPSALEDPREQSDEAGDGHVVAFANLQRAVPRQPVDWTAKYRFQADPPERWRDCRISDISTAGGGLRLFGIRPIDAEGRGIDILVQLSGEVRNAEPGMKRDLRVGVEFVDLAGDAAKFVESLRRSDFRW